MTIHEPSPELSIELCAAVKALVDAVAVIVQLQDDIAAGAVDDLPEDEAAIITVKFKVGEFSYQLDEDDDEIKVTLSDCADDTVLMVIRVGGE